MKVSKFAGVGMYVPPRVWTNKDLSTLMDTSDEWIRTRTGIESRHWVDIESSTCSSDLALEASRRALQSAGLQAADLDLIIFATLSPDHDFPGSGCFLQAKLGCPLVPALDIRQQCSGFVYGLSIADQFIRSGMYKNVLIVGAETHSKGIDKSTRGRDVAVLFGDGAGAAVLTVSEIEATDRQASQIFSTHLHADGTHARELWIDEPSMARPGDRFPAPKEKANAHYPFMNGKNVFLQATKRMPEVIRECLEANRISIDQVDLFVLHQANLRINEMVAKQLGIESNKVFNTIQKYGNTTAATIPIGLSEAVSQGVLREGMLVLSAAFGSGYTWGAALYRW